jgi:hypothetical protein
VDAPQEAAAAQAAGIVDLSCEPDHNLERFSSDILGTNRGRYPRHSRRYGDLAALEEQMQVARVAAFEAFAADLTNGGYPAAEHGNA